MNGVLRWIFYFRFIWFGAVANCTWLVQFEYEPSHCIMLHSCDPFHQYHFIFPVYLCGGRNCQWVDRHGSDAARHFSFQPGHQPRRIASAGQKERKESDAAGEEQTRTAFKVVKYFLLVSKAICLRRGKITINGLFVLTIAWELDNWWRQSCETILQPHKILINKIKSSKCFPWVCTL